MKVIQQAPFPSSRVCWQRGFSSSDWGPQLFSGYWLKAWLSFLPNGSHHRAAHKAAGFPQHEWEGHVKQGHLLLVTESWEWPLWYSIHCWVTKSHPHVRGGDNTGAWRPGGGHLWRPPERLPPHQVANSWLFVPWTSNPLVFLYCFLPCINFIDVFAFLLGSKFTEEMERHHNSVERCNVLVRKADFLPV